MTKNAYALFYFYLLAQAMNLKINSREGKIYTWPVFCAI
jgi:hypothetical protein